eukprot:2515121-Pyramimonas_sp.AAC.1
MTRGSDCVSVGSPFVLLAAPARGCVAASAQECWMSSLLLQVVDLAPRHIWYMSTSCRALPHPTWLDSQALHYTGLQNAYLLAALLLQRGCRNCPGVE